MEVVPGFNQIIPFITIQFKFVKGTIHLIPMILLVMAGMAAPIRFLAVVMPLL